MYDWHLAEYVARLRAEHPGARELEVARYLAETEALRSGPRLRRRLAGLIVGLGLRLDPEVTLSVPVRVRV